MADKGPGDRSRVCIGLITGTHGLAGGVRIKSYAGDAQDIAAYGPLEDKLGERTFELVEIRLGKKGVTGRLKGINDQKNAEALKGTELYVAREKLPLTGQDEWYYDDLVGLGAYDKAGTRLGEVTAVQNYGAGDLLEIKLETGKPGVLVPFLQTIVTEVDIDRGRIVIDAPEGLLDD